MKKNILYLVLLFVCLYRQDIQAQSGKNKFKLIDSLAVRAEKIYADHLGNIYIVRSNDEFIKMDSLCKTAVSFSSKKFGNLESADVSNPLRILLFYKEFQQIIILDNTLSEISSYSLSQLNKLATIASSGNDNTFWIYDSPSRKLKKIQDHSSEAIESPDLYMVTDELPQPDFLLSTSSNLYLNDPRLGIFIFDIFGTYLKTIPVQNVFSLQLIRNKLFIMHSKEVLSYDPQTLQMEQGYLPGNDKILSACISGNRLYTLTEKGVFLWRILP